MPDPISESPEALQGCAQPAIRTVMMPRDTNPQGTIFGGVIMSLIDQAAFVEALGHGGHRYVTVAVDRITFKHPVRVGDVVSLYTKTLSLGNTSIRIQVVVDSLRGESRRVIRVTEAEVVLVAVDADGHPMPIRSIRQA
ncbi:MAG: acyl-CoA thioesterase [Phycisphaerales bacterium]